MGNSITENHAIILNDPIDHFDQEKAEELTETQDLNGRVQSNTQQALISLGKQIAQKCSSFFTCAPILEPVGVFNEIGANLVEEYRNQENQASLAEIAQKIGNNSPKIAIDGLMQVVFFRALEHAIPEIRYLPFETLVTALGFAAEVARAEEEKRAQTALENASNVAKKIGTAIIVTSCSHLLLGAAAKLLMIRAINELVKGGIEATLQKSTPLLDIQQPIPVEQ